MVLGLTISSRRCRVARHCWSEGVGVEYPVVGVGLGETLADVEASWSEFSTASSPRSSGSPSVLAAPRTSRSPSSATSSSFYPASPRSPPSAIAAGVCSEGRGLGGVASTLPYGINAAGRVNSTPPEIAVIGFRLRRVCWDRLLIWSAACCSRIAVSATMSRAPDLGVAVSRF